MHHPIDAPNTSAYVSLSGTPANYTHVDVEPGFGNSSRDGEHGLRQA
ncbi:hypothetical protein [Nocardia thailandica]|nr:hypothetical protein [Nocardia thailandica]